MERTTRRRRFFAIMSVVLLAAAVILGVLGLRYSRMVTGEDRLFRSAQLLAYGAVAVGSMAIPAVLIVWMLHRDERAQRELELLRRKNETIEALNRRTNELAHHQRLETIGTLTSSIAHEFNNLLTPIMGYSILALERIPQEDTELYDWILEIYDASRKAKDIIARLSDLSRKNAPENFRPLSPDTLVRRVLDVAAPARPARVEVVTQLEAGTLRVQGNETQLSQMLLNLVLNGFQAIGPEGGTLTVSTAADGNWVRFRVSDTGVGIDPAIRPYLFEPFFTTKESGKGTGLGLAIVQQVVESHGGEIAVESQPGKGASFTIHLPAVSEPEPESPPEEE